MTRQFVTLAHIAVAYVELGSPVCNHLDAARRFR
jgi:hypothetical protein